VEKTFAQSELEAIAAALADTSEGLTGTEIGHILASLKMADPAPTMTKWRRLHNAFVERQNYSQNRRAILQFIRELRHSREITLLCSPKVTHHHDQLGGVLPPGKSAVLPPGKSVVLPRGNCSVRACPCPPPQSNRLRRRTVSPATSARYAPLARMM